METLIDDLLALAHGGSRITDLEPVDLAAVVAEVWENVDTKQATLENRSETNLLADRSRLHQLIENLVRNAIEHGGESVTVTVGDAEGGFSIADDGLGIPAENPGAIFEAGYSTNERGTVLGLSIVSEVADAHGWDVRLEEDVKEGTQFRVSGVEAIE